MVDLKFLESNSLGDETEELLTVTSQYKEKKTKTLQILVGPPPYWVLVL